MEEVIVLLTKMNDKLDKIITLLQNEADVRNLERSGYKVVGSQTMVSFMNSYSSGGFTPDEID
jgi:hypothetical protein